VGIETTQIVALQSAGRGKSPKEMYMEEKWIKIVTRLVSKLEITSGEEGSSTEDPVYKEVLAALLGKNDNTITIADAEYSGTRWIVLGAVDAEHASRRPILIKAHLHRAADLSTNWGCICKETLPRLEKLGWLNRQDGLTTEDVAGFFVSRANGIHKETAEFPATWAPAAGESFAEVPIGGDLPERAQSTGDENWASNSYDWFDLNDVPIGGAIYRISCNGTLWLFKKREERRWEVTIVPSMKWATTGRYNGYKDFGALLDGALLAYKMTAVT